MTAPIVLPTQLPGVQRAWHLLFDLHERLPTSWTIVGGQMVILHCAARATIPARSTEDLDAALDVRLHPHILRDFTAVLTDLGFTSAGESPAGHQHRWVTEDGAQVDLLIPRHLGERAEKRTGVTGGTTISSPAIQQALDRSTPVEVDISGHVGTVNLPSLHAAIVGKAAAYEVTLDRHRTRHLVDLCVLLTLLRPGDGLEHATRRDLEHLGNAVGVLTERPDVLGRVEDAQVALVRARELMRFARIRLERGRGTSGGGTGHEEASADGEPGN